MRRVILVSVGLALLACAGSLGELTGDVKRMARTKAIEACTKAAKELPKGSEDKVCGCVADEVVAKLSLEQLAEMAKNGPDPKKVQSAAKKCLKSMR